jgi:hypothetical protein
MRLDRRLVSHRIGGSHPDLHFYTRAEPIDDRHQAINREAVEVRIADARKIGSRDARTTVRAAHGQVFPVESLDDLGGQDGLELLGVRTLAPQVAKDIAAPPYHLEFFLFHRNISFSLFKRSLIRSISRFGVLMPCVDFFWNVASRRPYLFNPLPTMLSYMTTSVKERPPQGLTSSGMSTPTHDPRHQYHALFCHSSLHDTSRSRRSRNRRSLSLVTNSSARR